MPVSPVSPWPPSLAGTPAIAVIERAIAGNRLGHSLLLHGDDLELLTAVAEAIADRLLHGGETNPTRRSLGEADPVRRSFSEADPVRRSFSEADPVRRSFSEADPVRRSFSEADPVRRSFSEGGHPDYFALRPSGKMRLITAEATRDLITKVQVTPAVAPCKVAIVHEADRMNTAAANIFLKTLEEPPARTMLVLLTTHPYALLPTILSRCLHFKFSPRGENLSADPSAGASAKAEARRAKEDLTPAQAAWRSWLDDYRAWLGRLGEGSPDKRAVADHLLSLYGLVARFGSVLERGAAEAWEKQKAGLPPDLEEDEQIAIETGLSAGLRARFFADIENATRAFAQPRVIEGDEPASRAFTAAIRRLEHDARLLRLNLNESAALEDFLLSSLRLWGRR